MTTTETTTAPGPGRTSPGRAACEAFWAAVGAGPDVQGPSAAWEWAFSQNTTSAWEVAAKVAASAAEAMVAAVRDLCRSIPSPIAERILAVTGTEEENK